MPFNVGVMGASLRTANRGVSALAASVAHLIWQSHPDASISLLIGNRDSRPTVLRVDDGVKSVETVNYRLSPRAPLEQQLWCIVLLSWLYHIAPSARTRRWIVARNTWIRFVAAADFVADIRGGDSFSDIYGTKGFILDCLAVLSVIWIRGGIHLLPQTYGPFRSRLARRFARYILLHAESIWSRDLTSVGEVQALTQGQRRGVLCPDVAFTLQARRPETPSVTPPIPEEPGTTLIGLNVSGLVYHGGYTRANMFGLSLDYPTFLKRLLQQLLSDASNRVLLVPHTLAPDGRVESDPAACRDVLEATPQSFRGRVHLVTGDYDQHELKGLIGACDFFIGSRMHACIAALSQGIPTVGVAYSRKFSGVFETVGSEDWVIDARTASVPDALSRVGELFEQREVIGPILQANVATAQDDLRAMFKALLSIKPIQARAASMKCYASHPAP